MGEAKNLANSPAEEDKPAEVDENAVREEKINELEILSQSLADQKKKTQEYYDQLLRLRAEFENYKKREEKTRNELINWGREQLIVNLLPLLDDLEKAKAQIAHSSVSSSGDSSDKKINSSARADKSEYSTGIKLIYKKIWDILKKEGLKVQVVKGRKFNPQEHHAAGQIETDKYPEGEIIEEIQRGYLLGEKVIRPAVVKVAKSPKQ